MVTLILPVIIVNGDIEDWENLVDNGFGEFTNYSTRGIEIYNDELYIGTENLNKVLLGGSVTGIVYGNHNGNAIPLSSAQVRILGYTVSTGTDGVYNIGNLILGITYRVTASKQGYRSQTQYATPTRNNPVVHLDFVLEEDGGGGGGGGNGSISGTVYGRRPGGSYPLAFARVQTAGRMVYTDLTGSYRISGLPIGPTYTVTASKIGYRSQSKQVTLTLGNPDATVSFTLDQIGGGGGDSSLPLSRLEMTIIDNSLSIQSKDNQVSGMYNEVLDIEAIGYGGEGGLSLMAFNSDIPLEFSSLLWIPQINGLFSQGMALMLHGRSIASNGGEIWKYNHNTGVWTPIVSNRPGAMLSAGFGYSNNLAVAALKVFNGYLYAGTWSTPLGSNSQPNRKGCEIWRFDGSRWEQVVGLEAYLRGGVNGGFGDPNNVAAWTMEVFNGYLYVGTMNWDRSPNGQCQIWRTNNGLQWEKVVDRGFRDIGANENVYNTYIWNMKVYQGQLYAGTFNSQMNTGLYAGAQLWRTMDGVNWTKVELPGGDGFGEPENYGIKGLAVYNNALYVGTETSAFQLDDGSVEACEIWRYDGSSWTPIIGDDVPGARPGDPVYDGFGNHYNKYAWILYPCNGRLWVGTANTQFTGSVPIFESQGCEVWSYNGSTWTPHIKNGIGDIQSGFGKVYNIGARSLIEYPTGSGILFIGTFKLKSFNLLVPEEGCEIWTYHIRRW